MTDTAENLTEPRPGTRAVVVYESMYGNTRQIAEAIADGIARSVPARALHVADVHSIDFAGLDLLVVGAPTHAWSLSRPRTRRAAVTQATGSRSGNRLHVEPRADGTGVREWLAATGGFAVRFAAFDTRFDAPFGLSGSAARRIARAVRHRGGTSVAQPRGFLVTKQNTLQPQQLEHAREWGEFLAASAFPSHRDGRSRTTHQA